MFFFSKNRKKTQEMKAEKPESTEKTENTQKSEDSGEKVGKGLGTCMMSRSLVEGRSKLKWLFRDEGMDDADSGWRAVGDTDSQEDVDEALNFVMVPFSKLAELEPSVVDIFDMPIWTELEYDPETRKFREVEDADDADPEDAAKAFENVNFI